MPVTLHVSNLPYDVDADALQALFGGYGDVHWVRIPTDDETGRPRGFAFVEMVEEVGAQAAIGALHQSRIGSRTVRVARARPRR